jgi:hypothetical protein
MFALVSLLRIYAYLRAVWIYPRLKNAHTLLEGEITSVKGEEKGSSPITIYFKFKSPQNRWIYGKERIYRRKRKNIERPAIGSLVSVLYADDRAYMML